MLRVSNMCWALGLGIGGVWGPELNIGPKPLRDIPTSSWKTLPPKVILNAKKIQNAYEEKRA